MFAGLLLSFLIKETKGLSLEEISEEYPTKIIILIVKYTISMTLSRGESISHQNVQYPVAKSHVVLSV